MICHLQMFHSKAELLNRPPFCCDSFFCSDPRFLNATDEILNSGFIVTPEKHSVNQRGSLSHPDWLLLFYSQSCVTLTSLHLSINNPDHWLIQKLQTQKQNWKQPSQWRTLLKGEQLRLLCCDKNVWILQAGNPCTPLEIPSTRVWTLLVHDVLGHAGLQN